MSEWARENPDGDIDQWAEQQREKADLDRKDRRENPPLPAERKWLENKRKAKEQEDRERQEAQRLSEIHKGDPAYDNLQSLRAIRQQQERDRENDEMMRRD